MNIPARNVAGAELICETLRTQGHAQFRVHGVSMRPLLCGGDMLTVQRTEMLHVRRGDVVVFARAGGMFAHRVIENQEQVLITKGDAFPEADKPVTSDELLGRVTAVERNGRRTALDTRFQIAMGKIVAQISAAAPLWYPKARAVKRMIRAAVK